MRDRGEERIIRDVVSNDTTTWDKTNKIFTDRGTRPYCGCTPISQEGKQVRYRDHGPCHLLCMSIKYSKLIYEPIYTNKLFRHT